MPRTTESAFNVELGNVLRRKHPLWRDRIGVEQHHVFQAAALRPDLIVYHPGGLPVALETEFEPARTVEKDARSRLGQVITDSGDGIEQSIAVRVPSALSQGQADLTQRIDESEFLYCVFSEISDGHERWPKTGWIHGKADDLAACVERVSVSERLVTRGMKILEKGVRQSAWHFLEDERLGFDSFAIDVANILHQERCEQTARMAMAILANAMIFHNVISGTHNLKKTSNIIDDLGNISSHDLLNCWHMVINKINYWPIFDIASKILNCIRPKTTPKILELLSKTADQLSTVGVTSLHDMSGRMFQKLIVDRKFLATFYTLPTSAALLSELSVDRLDYDWTKSRSLRQLRIADLACGTGTLISAAYQSVLSRYRRAGGDDARLHRGMMERTLIAADIMPAATHLAASMLSSAHPGHTFRRTRVITMPYGAEVPGQPLALGSLDLILDDKVRPLFGTGQLVATGNVGEVEMERVEDEVRIDHESVDLIIMNPPFTKPTNHTSTTVPVPSFAGFGKDKSDQRAMSNRLKRIRQKITAPVGHGNAGLASNFVDLAHAKVKSGGVLAIVLPASAIQGNSWKNFRQMLFRDYLDLNVISIVASRSSDRSFSADTAMAEVLIVANKKRLSEDSTADALYVNLYNRPSSLAEAAETARTIGNIPKDRSAGKLRLGDKEIVGNFVRASLGDGGAAGLREESIANAMLGFRSGQLLLPRCKGLKIPTTTLGLLGVRGLLHRDISGNGVNKNAPPRGPFDVIPVKSITPTYPMLWRHYAERERRLVVEPDTEGLVRPECDARAVQVWNATASRLHFNLGFRLNSQSLAACITDEPSIGGSAWPNFLPNESQWAEAIVLCANTTLGLMSFWWMGSNQHQGRAVMTISTLPNLPILDVSSLNESKIDAAKQIFEMIRGHEFLPANEAYRDNTRKELDRAVLADLFDIPPQEIETLDTLRKQWCEEPSVHGGKSTRISVNNS